MIAEKPEFSVNGYLVFCIVLPLLQIAFGIMLLSGTLQIVAVIASVIVASCWGGFFMVQPNQGRVMT